MDVQQKEKTGSLSISQDLSRKWNGILAPSHQVTEGSWTEAQFTEHRWVRLKKAGGSGSQSYDSEIMDSGTRDHISGQRPGVPAWKKRWRSSTINGIFLLLMLEATLSRMSRPSLVGILWSGVFTVCAPGNLLASKLHRWLSCHLGKPWGL